MNSSGFSRIALTFAIVIVALWVSLDVFSGGGNALGKVYFYLLIMGGAVGLFAPKRAFYVLLFLTAYLDYFKRLMILDSGMTQLDLYYVLGIAPIMVAGISLSLLYSFTTGSVRWRPYEGRTVIFVLCACTLALVNGILGAGGGGTDFGYLANVIGYIPLLFIIPLLFRTPEELRYIFKVAIIMFIPSVVYYLYQTYAGFTKWEMRYLLSGYTIEVRQLFERVPRVFGTLNSAAAASIIYALFTSILLFSGIWKYRDDSGKVKPSAMFGRLFVASLFAWACYRTFSRAGQVQGVVAALGFFAFRDRILTKSIYVAMALVIFLVVAFSGYMLKHSLLNEWSVSIAGEHSSDERKQALSLGSFNARLEGFHSMFTDASLWTPFGQKLAGNNVEKILSAREFHDGASTLILRYGYIPILFGGCLAFFGLRALHRFAYQQPPGLSSSLAATSLSCALAIMLGVIHTASAMGIYPTNFYIYMFIGTVISLMAYHADLTNSGQKQVEDVRGPLYRRRDQGSIRSATAPRPRQLAGQMD